MAVADKFTSAALHDLAEADEEVSYQLFLRLEKRSQMAPYHAREYSTALWLDKMLM